MTSSLLQLASPLTAIHAKVGSFTTSQITSRLYVSDWFAAQNISNLHSLGITHVVSVVEVPPILGGSIKHMHIFISDWFGADLAKHFDSTTDFIRQALSQQGTKVLVHCLGGLSRSISVVCAYLIAAKGMTAQEAILYTHDRRIIAHPNAGFRVQLETYATRLGLGGEVEKEKVHLNPLERGMLRRMVSDRVKKLVKDDDEILKIATAKALGPDWTGTAVVSTTTTVQEDATVQVDVSVAPV